MEFYDGELLGEQDHRYGDHRVGRGEKTGYRTIPAKDTSTRSWKRFALLPNVEGQKYTIGNTFTSREDQGELIFWLDAGVEEEDTGVPKIKPNSLCEISIAKNAYWIRPLMGNKIYVNDVEIKASTQINFGDHISFGEERKFWAKILVKEPSPVRLLFKKREFPPEIVSSSFLPENSGRSQWDQDSATSLGQNALLVSLILCYIPVQNLAQLRLVSKVWNEEGVKLVKKKCQVHFNFVKKGWGFDESDKSTKLFQYSVDMKNCLLQNWKITLPALKQGRYGEGLDYSAGKPGAKLLADLEWFLLPRNLGHSIRKLELSGNIVSTKDLDVRAKILKNLASTLQDLVLSGVWYCCDYRSEGIEFPIINFKQLERFTLKWYADEEWTTPYYQTWLQSVIQSIQGVKALRFGWWDEDDVTPIFLRNPAYFPKLEEIGFDKTTPPVINLLLGLGKPLKKIELGRIQELKDVESYGKLLQFHSTTLESLEFVVPLFNSRVRIIFPVMPKLKRLTVGVLRGNPIANVATLAFSEGDPLNYSQQFPTLQSLTLRDVYGLELDNFWEDSEQSYDAFFPQDLQVCETLRYLDIPFQDVNHHVFPRAAQVAEMFPNVHNPWINEARKKGSAE